MPYFSVTLEPEHPAVDSATLIVVRLWADVGHTQPASMPVTTLARLIAIRSDDRSFPDINPALGWNESSGAYEATVIFPAAGSWTLVAFPDRSGWSSPEIQPGYPDTIPIEVLGSAGGASEQSVSPAARWEAYTLVALAALVALWALRRRRDPRLA